MRLYIDLPNDIVEKVRALALKEDRDPKQQIEYLVKRAIEKAFRDDQSAAEECGASYAPALQP